MTASRRAGFSYLLLTIALALACAALGYVLFDTVLEGKAYAGTKSARRVVSAAADPVEFGLRVAFAFALWLLACGYVGFRIKVWLKRREFPEVFEAQVARLEKTTSKTGNALAWILAVPFILIALVVVIGMAMGYGPR